MIKGCATIQIFDENTGKVVRELHEENMITNAVDTILNPPDYIEIGMDSDNDRSFNMLRDFAGNLADTAFRGVIVCRDKIPEDGNNMMLPWTNEEIGHAGIANTNTNTSIGTYNANESGRIENGKGYRHVWDFASDKANGEISCICLTTKDGGTNGMHHSYWNLSCGGTDLNSSSLDSFRQAYHTIVGRYIPDSQFNCGVFKWFYLGRLTNGNVRLLGKHIHDGCIYEVVMFDPMSISVSTEKPFCGIISVKKVIELFPAAERIPDSMYDNSYHHGGYFYDCNTTNADYVPQEEKEKLRQDWEDNPQWLAYFPYVIGDMIHIVATSRCHIHHYIFSLSDYSQVSKKTIETDALLQTYGVGFKYERISNSSSQYRWFYGAGVNGDYCNALSAFEWDGKYFVITKNPLIDGKKASSTNNFGQFRVFTKDGKSTGEILQYIADGTLSNMTYCQEGISFPALKQAGVKFAIIRAGFSTKKDVTMDKFVVDCRKYGIDYGFYWYSYAMSIEQAEAEAEKCISVIKGLSPTYPVFFDMEEKKQISGLNTDTRTKMAIAFCEKIRQAGFKPGVYANPSFMENYYDKSRIVGKYDIWLAHWTNNPDYPSKYNYGQTMWQWGVDRIGGYDVDGDICFTDYSKKKPVEKAIDQLADEVLAGKWDNGAERERQLTAAGYDYNAVQKRVNEKLYRKTTDEIAVEVIAGLWGNGSARKEKLTEAGYDYSEVQRKVNQLIK